jgi:hypothetical protein
MISLEQPYPLHDLHVLDRDIALGGAAASHQDATAVGSSKYQPETLPAQCAILASHEKPAVADQHHGSKLRVTINGIFQGYSFSQLIHQYVEVLTNRLEWVPLGSPVLAHEVLLLDVEVALQWLADGKHRVRQ